MPIRRIAVVLFLLGTLSACGGIVDPSKNQVDSLAGIVPVGGTGPTHSLSIGKDGEFFITPIAITPDPNVFVGILLGQPTSGGCVAFTANDFSQLNRQALGGQINKGDYCIQVYDSGYLAQPTSYTLRFSHP